MDAGKLLEIDQYKEVAEQGQAQPLSPAYVLDPMELDEHVLVYVLTPEHPKYHVPLEDDMQVEDQPYADDASPTAESPGYIADSESMEEDSIHYPDELEDDNEDSKEDPKEDHTNYPADGAHGDEDDDEDEEEHLALADSSTVPVIDPVPLAVDTEAFETDEAQKTVRLEPPMSASMEVRIAEYAAAPTPPPPGHRGVRISVRPQTPMTTSTQVLIGAFIAGSPPFPLLPTSPAYDLAPLGHRAAMICMKESFAAAARPPRDQYDFIDTVKAGHGLIRSPAHDAWTIARAVDRAEDVGYVRALQDSEHRMMTSIKEVNLMVSYQAQVRRQEGKDFYTQLHDAQIDRRDIRLDIDVVRGQRTAYETELHDVRQVETDIKEKDKIKPKTRQNQAGNGKRGKVNQVKVKPVKTGHEFGKSTKNRSRRHKYLIGLT
nr:hypothetical protein [Tanacetum cinerariifolium]